MRENILARRILTLSVVILTSNAIQGQFVRPTPDTTGLYPNGGIDVPSKTVVLNDLEDHGWAYYSDTNSPVPLHSFNPIDVKIIYYGNGNTVATTTDDYPDPSTCSSPSVHSRSDGAAVGISAFDRRFDKFVYYQTLERVDGNTASTPESATGRCAYRTIFNPFSMRPVYSGAGALPTTIASCRTWTGWRGFYVWRLKSTPVGGSIYRTASGGTPLVAGDTIGADVTVYFDTPFEYGMTVELEALWARAYVSASGNGNRIQAVSSSYTQRGVHISDVGIERNFVVLQYYYHALQAVEAANNRTTPQGIFDKNGSIPTFPVTYTSVFPNGTSNGTTKSYANDAQGRLCIGWEDYSSNSVPGTTESTSNKWRPVRCHGDTRFEYITIRNGINSGTLSGQNDVARSSFSADGYNFTLGRGMQHESKYSSGFNPDHGINSLWGIGRLTLPTEISQKYMHQFYGDHYISEYLGSTDNDETTAEGRQEMLDRANAAAAAANNRSLNYTLRLETGRIGTVQAIYGWGHFITQYAPTQTTAEGRRTCPRIWVTGSNNKVRLIIGNDYDRAREEPKRWTPRQAKDSCSFRMSIPFRAGNYWIQMPNQDETKVFFEAVVKSGFIGYRMWRRAFDSTTDQFYAGGNATPGYNYDTLGYEGGLRLNGKSGQYDARSNYNGSLPYGFGDGGTDGDPKNIYVCVSNNATMAKGKRRMLIEGGYLYTSVSGGAWDTSATNKNDNDVAIIRMKGGNIYGSIFGGTNTYAPGAGGRQVICTGGKVWGWICGGANGTEVADDNGLGCYHEGNTYIYAGGRLVLGNDTSDRRVGTYFRDRGWTGANDGNLFGAGCGLKPYNYKYIGTASEPYNDNCWKYHRAGEVWNSTVVVADQANVKYNVYGGGNYGFNAPACSSDVRILGGRVGGKVFGGSNNKSTGASNILMTGGLVEQGVYGGCNSWGVLLGDVRMDIIGGTIGTSTWPNAGVYGGGFGQNTTTSGNITVNIGDSTTWTGPTVYGDIYGGSQMGMVLGGDTINNDQNLVVNKAELYIVNIDTANSYSASRKGTVNYYGGDVRGNIYGGGYGQNGQSATSYGKVHVRILGSGANDVYGANNEAGNPMGKVLVTIGSTDSLATDRNLPLVNGNVYGGGNLASYGTHATTTTLTVEMLSGTVQKNVFGGGRGTTAVVNLPSGHAGLSNDRATEVFIKNGTIRGNVYGGGNAAKVVGNTRVVIGE